MQEKPDYENAIFLIKIFTDRFIEAPVDDSGSILPVGKCHFKVKNKDKENFADLAVLSVLLTLSRYLTSLNLFDKFESSNKQNLFLNNTLMYSKLPGSCSDIL